MNLTKKQQALVTLAKKRGNDADLVLLNLLHELSDKIDVLEGKIDKDAPEDTKVERIAIKLAAKLALLEKGDKGDEPSNERLVELIHPLIPDPISGQDGEPGKNYVLSAKDKKDIAAKIKVPVVEKVIVEKPIVTQEIKEVVIAEPPEVMRDKLESLSDDERLDISAIKGSEKLIEDLKSSKKNISVPGWGAHPLAIQQSGSTKVKVARVINFTGATVTQSVQGVTTVAISASLNPQTPSGTINGSNRNFTISGTINALFVNGQFMVPGGVDYTLSGTTITLVTAPPINSTIYAI